MTTDANVERGGSEGKHGPKRPLARTLRRKALPLLAVFSVLASIIFLAAPTLKRTYQLAGTVNVKVQTFDPLPELARLPDAALKQISQPSVKATAKDASPGTPGNRTIELSASAASRDSAVARMQMFADSFAKKLDISGREVVENYRLKLRRSADQLASREQTLGREINEFRLKHRGALPDDPSSTLGQFQKLLDRLDEKQTRLNLVNQHIGRLQEYKKINQANGGRGATPPPPLPAADAPDVPAAPVRAESDPEVVTLMAQLQLINKQIEEQLTTAGRTEQHPYVVGLRNQQTAKQKELDAAKQRVAAGKPPPAGSQVVEATTRPGETNLLAVDMQLENLQAERDALTGEVKNLSARRDDMQAKVDQVLPIRQEFEKLTSELASTRKERELVRTRTEDFERQFGGRDARTADIVELTPLAMTSNSTLPSFPRVSLVFVAALAMGAIAAAALALVLHRMDRALHTPQDVLETLDVPVIGTISEIRTPQQLKFRRMWLTAGQPAVVLALVALALGSAALCYVRLANPAYQQTAQGGDAGATYFAASGRAP